MRRRPRWRGRRVLRSIFPWRGLYRLDAGCRRSPGPAASCEPFSCTETSMKLYTGRLSLFARKVEVALLEKGTRLRTRGGAVQPDNGLYSPRHPDVMAANPKGQIPVFVD